MTITDEPKLLTKDSEYLRAIIVAEIVAERIAESSAVAIADRVFDRLASEGVRGLLTLRYPWKEPA